MNIILMSLDSVRMESLSCYTNSFGVTSRLPYRSYTPNIDSIASDGTVFSEAVCHAPFTPASHASMFTGLNPYDHGISGMFGYQLNDKVTTIAEVLKNYGFQTGAFIGSHALNKSYGLNKGYSVYNSEFDSSIKNWVIGSRRPAEEVTAEFLDWYDTEEENKFAFVHYFDAHDGGRPASSRGTQESNNSGFSELKKLYKSYFKKFDRYANFPIRKIFKEFRRITLKDNYGIRYQLRKTTKIDKNIGKIIRELKRENEYESSLIIITSDHGDAFGEHNERSHRRFLYDTTLRVPMIIKPPNESRINNKITSNTVCLRDIPATISGCINENNINFRGMNLFSSDNIGKRFTYAETRFEKSLAQANNPITDLMCVRSRNWKYIYSLKNENGELYNLSVDPNETNDISSNDEKKSKYMKDILRKRTGLKKSKPNLDIADEIMPNLKDLGYIKK